MQPGEVVTGWVELAWGDDQPQDWSIVTYGNSGKIEIKLTDMPNRPSDTSVGYYAGSVPSGGSGGNDGGSGGNDDGSGGNDDS